MTDLASGQFAKRAGTSGPISLAIDDVRTIDRRAVDRLSRHGDFRQVIERLTRQLIQCQAAFSQEKPSFVVEIIVVILEFASSCPTRSQVGTLDDSNSFTATPSYVRAFSSRMLARTHVGARRGGPHLCLLLSRWPSSAASKSSGGVPHERTSPLSPEDSVAQSTKYNSRLFPRLNKQQGGREGHSQYAAAHSCSLCIGC
ncbi:hypothetical protein VFPFJ_01225 [Purpureocillium lilacinum]|uniref:Uncharacterized protein n=1 Tax=Purpureocillium lilacinum TaxID=33203 RepID=A0A179HX69_PURLI|nr:hypothetical protein VFPFJ_01225 [Purpureocillium lilacinum]OAQ87161.1 hypothetical protein VFPBJ_01201 [Purpureocillium lilacinum]OAQ95116.1 hypothetical protein VFPFJ_01225 [Purpureocillium lilacinum]